MGGASQAIAQQMQRQVEVVIDNASPAAAAEAHQSCCPPSKSKPDPGSVVGSALSMRLIAETRAGAGLLASNVDRCTVSTCSTASESSR